MSSRFTLVGTLMAELESVHECVRGSVVKVEGSDYGR